MYKPKYATGDKLTKNGNIDKRGKLYRDQNEVDYKYTDKGVESILEKQAADYKRAYRIQVAILLGIIFAGISYLIVTDRLNMKTGYVRPDCSICNAHYLPEVCQDGISIEYCGVER